MCSGFARPWAQGRSGSTSVWAWPSGQVAATWNVHVGSCSAIAREGGTEKWRKQLVTDAALNFGALPLPCVDSRR